MRIKLLLGLAALASLVCATPAFAQNATIQGTAADKEGRPLKNAEVRIQQENSKAAPMTAKTDAKGFFNASGLPVGTYHVAVVVGKETKWSAAHVKANANQVVRLNLSGKQVTVQTASAAPAKKRSVFIQSGTGSHLGGHFEDDPYRGPSDQNVQNLSDSELRRVQTARGSGY